MVPLLQHILITSFAALSGIWSTFGITPIERAILPQENIPPIELKMEQELTKKILIPKAQPGAELLTATSSPADTVVTEVVEVVPVPLKEVETSTTPETLNTPQLTFPTEGVFAPINQQVRSALVNIFCQRKEGRTTHTTSGSGVIIDRRGVVLTNAHVADLFLIKGTTKLGSTNCYLRTGSPARDAYKAELLFISPTWISTFAPTLTAKNPRGTGEEDFALLLITRTDDPHDELPTSFPAIQPDIQPFAVTLHEQLLIAGYPALVESIASLVKRLYVVSTLANTTELFTFDVDRLDLFELTGTIASQEGASGGAVVNMQGKLVGIVVTSTRGKTALDRELRALTLEHIDRRIQKETGQTLTAYISGDLTQIQKNFAENYREKLGKELVR